MESAEGDLTKALEAEIAKATEALRAEAAEARAGQGRVKEFERTAGTGGDGGARSAGTRRRAVPVESGGGARPAWEDEGRTAGGGGALERVSAERAALGEQLATQIEAGKAEAARWEHTLEEARKQATNTANDSSQQQYELLRKDFKKLKAKAQELQNAKDELEFKLEVRKEEAAKELETLAPGTPGADRARRTRPS